VRALAATVHEIE